jgi:CHAT domain-containing protein
MGMNLSNTDLLVLSACQSGLGDLGNDGTYGIQRSFKIAGVKSIIMSLWEVDDEATRIMMTALYEKLAKGNTIKDSFDYAVETVRKAYVGRAKEQPKSIPRHKRYDSAYYWNSFILLD